MRKIKVKAYVLLAIRAMHVAKECRNQVMYSNAREGFKRYWKQRHQDITIIA